MGEHAKKLKAVSKPTVLAHVVAQGYVGRVYFPITIVPDGERGRMICSHFITLYSLFLPSLHFRFNYSYGRCFLDLMRRIKMANGSNSFSLSPQNGGPCNVKSQIFELV